MRPVNTTLGLTVLLSAGLASYAVGASQEPTRIGGADWDPHRAISQNLPVANHPSVPQNPYGSVDIDRYLAEDEFPPYTRERYRERSEPDVFSEDDTRYYTDELGRFPVGKPRAFLPDDGRYTERDEPRVYSEDNTLYYDHQAFAHDRFGYAKERFKKAAKRYRDAKRNFSKEQRQFFQELDRFKAEKEQFASASAGFARTMLGTLQERNGSIFTLKNSKGQTRKVHVGEDTLVDGSVKQGDDVIAKVLPNGHAIALVKDRGEKGISTQPLSGME